MVLKTLNGFWIIETPITGDVHRSHLFWNKKMNIKQAAEFLSLHLLGLIKI